jgi:hypothetical protein
MRVIAAWADVPHMNTGPACDHFLKKPGQPHRFLGELACAPL